MSSYVTHIEDANSIADVSKATLMTIERLDRAVQELSTHLDAEIASDKAKPDDLLQMRELLEDLTDRKSALAMTAYDYVDRCTRKADEDMELIEGAVRLNSKLEVPHLQDVLSQCDIESTKTSKGGHETAVASIIMNEPVYCVCRQIAHGEMISCDNDDCEIEWFHYGCVGLNKEPRNQWFCPICSNTPVRKRRH